MPGNYGCLPPATKIPKVSAGLSNWVWAVRLTIRVKFEAESWTTNTREPAMKFICLGYGEEKSWNAMSAREREAVIEECFRYDDELLKNGHWLDGGQSLQGSLTAKTLRWESGQVVVTDGPFAETKEQLGGIGVLEARDMDQAVELVSKHPGLRLGGPFEIRPVDEEMLERNLALDAKYRDD